MKPKLKSHFSYSVLEDDNVVLVFSEYQSIILSGKLYVKLFPLLTGEYDVAELTARLKDAASFMHIQFAISNLRRQRLIEDTSDAGSENQVFFWNQLGVDTAEAFEKLSQTPVSIENLSAQNQDAFVSVLADLGVCIEEHGPLHIVIVDDYEEERLRTFNQKALDSGQTWMLVKLSGCRTLIGPIFVPGETGCWECLAQRLRINREVQTFIRQKNNPSKPLPIGQTEVPSASQVASGIAASEIVRWIITGKSDLLGRIILADLLELTLTKHTLMKRPQCPVCGDPRPPELKPIELVSQKKRFVTDGGHRALTPYEVIDRFGHHVSPLTGVIAYMGLRLQRDGLLFIYDSHNNFDMPYTTWETLYMGLYQRSAGKGMTKAQAEASGIGEALERYSGCYFPAQDVSIRATYDEVRDQAVDPALLLQYSEQQYADWQKWYAIGGRQRVPAPLDHDRVTGWTQVWSLTENKFKYIPTAFCYYGYWLHYKEGLPFYWGDSNGSASGSTLEEAILQGAMELIERDCIAIWWYNRIKRPQVDLESFNIPYFTQLRQFYQSEGRDIWVIDITNDLGIPTFAAISHNVERPDRQEICVGYGAHFDPRIAAARALTEVNEMYTIVALHITDDFEYRVDDEIGNWLKNGKIEDHDYMVPDETLPMRRYEDFGYQYRDDILEDILAVRDIAAQHGIEMLVLDQTRPDVGMNVAKVIMPGLRHFWARFAPGRLYDVPVKLGWLQEPTPEDQLNPVPMFF